MTEILIVIFILLLFHYAGFILTVYNGLNKLSFVANETDVFISIIIPFRNEENKILRCLESIEAQEYDINKYEVIFVNDNSSDNSVKILEENISSHNIKVLNLDNFNSKRGHKKAAVNFGIKSCQGEIIVTTDADCIHDKQWLRTMISAFNNETVFVSGPVDFQTDSSIFSKLQRLEFIGLILTGAGLIGSGRPVICNGANLAFRKKVFYEVGGYDDLMHLSSGEDELLMQKIAALKSYKINFCFNKKAAVKTEANKSLKEFLNQRKRWASKGLFYKNNILVIKLIMIFLFYISLITQLFLGIFYGQIFLYTLLFSILIKMLIEFMVIYKGTEILFDRDVLKYFALAELLHVPYIVSSAIMGMFGNYVWKDREIER